MSDIKTQLRELSVATTIGLFKQEISFKKEELYNSESFLKYAKNVISTDLSDVNELDINLLSTDELKKIIDNGFQLGETIYNHPHFKIKKSDFIYWLGSNNQRDDPRDIIVGDYGFSLKEDSFILKNMGLYKLVNFYTGLKYKRNHHIFKYYSFKEYDDWFRTTWIEMLKYLSNHSNTWIFNNTEKSYTSKIIVSMPKKIVYLQYFKKNQFLESQLPINCGVEEYEKKTNTLIREKVFAKFINQVLSKNDAYNDSKKACVITASKALAKELNDNLDYHAGLPRFLGIHEIEYYYAKTTDNGVAIYKVPSIDNFGDNIIIKSIIDSVPDTQANILTTIKNNVSGKELTLRNECRFSHGQFNGTPEAKLYYENGGSLLTIYEPL